MDNLTQLFIQAGSLMLTGMIFVFTFLGLLVVFINTVLVKLAQVYPDAIVQRNSHHNLTNKNEIQNDVSPNVVAAISSAVTRYRQQHLKKQ